MSTTPQQATYHPAIKEITYAVPSKSEPGANRTVRINPYTRRPTSCDCPARGRCWHLTEIETNASAYHPRVRFGPVRTTWTPAAVARVESVISDLWG